MFFQYLVGIKGFILVGVIHVIVDWIWSLFINAGVEANWASSGWSTVDSGVRYVISWAITAVSIESVSQTHPLYIISLVTLAMKRSSYMSNFVGHCLSQVVVGCSPTWYRIEAVRGTRELQAVSG